MATCPRAMEDAIRLVLQQHDHQAGRFSVGYRSCDDSTAQTGNWENRRCAANANAYAAADDLVAMIGPFNSPCAQIEIPILNRARAGPLAIISPSNTHAGLTRPAECAPRRRLARRAGRLLPDRRAQLRPRGRQRQPASAARLRRSPGGWGCGGSTCSTTATSGSTLLADPFRNAAKRLGVRIAGSATYDPRAESYAALVDRVARSGADGVVLGGDPLDGGDKVVKALRARFGKRLTIMGSFFFGFVPDVLETVGPAALGMYVGTADIPRSALPLSAAGRQFAEDLGGASNEPWTLEAGQAMEVVLDAIARSDGTRASVLEADARDEGQARHPRHLRLRRERRHHARAGADHPHHRVDAAGGRAPAAVPGLGGAQRHPRAARARRIDQSNSRSCKSRAGAVVLSARASFIPIGRCTSTAG